MHRAAVTPEQSNTNHHHRRCPPCRQFTPRLAETYERLRKQRDGGDGSGGGGSAAEWEVVFVSMDRGPHQFDEYFGTMPWLAVPFADDAMRRTLAR